MNGRIRLFAVLVLLAVTAVLGSPGGSEATTFAPAVPAVGFSALAPGANPDITVGFNIPPPSANFSGQAGNLITFADSDVVIAGDAAIPNGAYIGSLTATWQLGLANEGCNNMVPVTYQLVEAATGGAVIAPNGTDINRLANLAEDDGDLDNDGFVDVALFVGNGIADGADAYPSFVAAGLDPDGPGGPAAPIVPLARYFGTRFVANTLISVVQIVVLAPGAVSPMPNFGWMTAAWGYPVLTILDNPLGPPSNSAISDFCNFTSSNLLLGISADNACTPAPGPAACAQAGGGFALRLAASAGCPGAGPPNECGLVRATNPGAPQTVTWRQYVVSQRDADNDGHENGLDPCPLTANAGWDPRVFNAIALDGDGDGLPTACDPNDAAFNNDQDGDGWQNRLDNCPLVANAQPIPPPPPPVPPPPAPNAFQYDQDVAVGVPVGDGGPQADGIGPACDPAPAGANGHYHATVAAFHICIGPATPDCGAGDLDGDGVANVSDNCIGGANAPPAGFAQSQRDLNVDGFVDIVGDIAPVAGAFNTTGGNPAAAPGYQGRFDLNYDNFIAFLGDLVQLAGVFGATC